MKGVDDYSENVIEDYLDHVFAPLIGLIPYIERRRMRKEIQLLLEKAAQQRRAAGTPPAEAGLLAIEELGDSGRISDDLIKNWQREAVKGRFRDQRAANAVAVVALCLTNLWIVALLRLYSLSRDADSAKTITFGLPPDLIRRVIPHPLPLPEATPLFVTLSLSLLLCPLAAGCLAGIFVFVRPAWTAVRSQAILTACTLLADLAFLKLSDALLMAGFQLLFWIPAEALAAAAASAAAWRLRCRYRSAGL